MNNAVQWTMLVLGALSTAALIGAVLILISMFSTSLAQIGLVGALLVITYIGIREEMYYRKEIKRYKDELSQI